jgi:hypothetical protein
VSVKLPSESAAAASQSLRDLATLRELGDVFLRLAAFELPQAVARDKEQGGEVFSLPFMSPAPDGAAGSSDPITGVHQVVADAVREQLALFLRPGIFGDGQPSDGVSAGPLDIELTVRPRQVSSSDPHTEPGRDLPWISSVVSGYALCQSVREGHTTPSVPAVLI